MDAEWSQLLFEAIKVGGPVTILVIYAMYAGYHKKWVWGWQLQEVVERNAELEDKLDQRIAELEKELRESLRLQAESHRQMVQMQRDHREVK